MEYSRFAVYYLPETSAFAEFGVRWLGYDCVTGKIRAAPEIADLPVPVAELTAKPRRYGFHATVMAPFYLAQNHTLDDLEAGFEQACSGLHAPTLKGLELSQMGRFLALTALGDVTDLRTVATHVVCGLNGFRAPVNSKELLRRTPARATVRQQELLRLYGYLYVEEAYRFHITLTGRLGRDDLAHVQRILAPELTPLLPRPFVIGDLALVAEDPQGYFHLIRRAALIP